ncbi:hypothetical protein B0T20DRAFT_475419 [Sordaria brevicollis]|uniref:Uncharacterized protein n=1 Tax=Sordaria brevicollis TaxID=83679 RepID=A0AAE0PJR5_SORBR|nr:hypothetical protein B0T20DRAFT_475419 [Sordaria brevicollis]
MAPEERIPLSTLVSRGMSSLKSLIEILAGGTGTGTKEESIASASSHLERFRLWVGSLGAHRESGPKSLEYKLRDASLIRDHIVTLLKDLCDSIDRALSVTSTTETTPEGQDQPNFDEDINDELAELFYDDDQDAIHRPELDQALWRVGYAVDCLLRLSATIRHPAPHDQFRSRVGAEIIEAFQPLDKDHIHHKFIRLDESLIDRLAKAMARRRQYFKYREEHASRIAHGLEEGLRSDASEYTAAKTVISSLPGHLKDNTCNNTTSGPSDMADFYDMDIEARSQTSYAPTMAESGELHVPRLPREACNGPFKCPFCHMIIEITGDNKRHQWKYVTLSSIHPYKAP